MRSWIHVVEWRAAVHPDVMALVDDRGARYTYGELRDELRTRSWQTVTRPPWPAGWPITARPAWTCRWCSRCR